SRAKNWWLRLASRCAGADCPKARKLWPYWLYKSEGTDFDGRWYCSRGCLETVLASRVHALLSSIHQEKPRSHCFPIGLILVDRGVSSHAQLRDGIRLQREAGHGKIGDWLRRSADLSTLQRTAALGQQWG